MDQPLAPGPRATTSTILSLPIPLNYHTSHSLFFVDPHAGALVPRGRRIQRPAVSAADPEEKSLTTWFAGVEVVVLKEEFPVCEFLEQETTKVFD